MSWCAARLLSVGVVSPAPRTIRSVDCVTGIRYLPMLLLTCRDATHWCTVGGDVERRLAAKKRPARRDQLDANYRQRGRWRSFGQVCWSSGTACDRLASARLLHFGAAHERADM